MNKYILVGVDDTPESQLALRWAVQAAEGRGSAVRVVRAYLNELSRWPALGVEGYVPPPMPLDKYQHEVEAAVRYARDRLGYEGGSGWLANNDPAHAILTEAGDADMVVVGTRSRNKMSAVVLGSVATSVRRRRRARLSWCAVSVVPDRWSWAPTARRSPTRHWPSVSKRQPGPGSH